MMTRTQPKASTGPIQEDVHALAAGVCLVGVLLRVVLSPPVLNALGVHYSGEEGGPMYQKIHPGTYLIYLAFFVFLADRGQPIGTVFRMARELRACSYLLFVYLLMFIWWLYKSPAGIGTMIDTHLPVPICAIVLSYAPPSYCRRAVIFLLVLAAVNSVIGIAESIGRFRILSFDPDWVVLKEDIFRSSALMGHPLNNGMLTAIALFTAMAVRPPFLVALVLVLVYLGSLVAFGGRGSFALSFLGLVPLAIVEIRREIDKGLSMMKLIFLLGSMLIVPIMVCGGLYALLTSGVGDRLMAMSSLNDESAASRLVDWQAFRYMTPDELVFGATADRVLDIAHRLGIFLPLGDIENPWILMFMNLGAIMFTVWLLATLLFIGWLLRGKSLALKAVVLVYFIVSSTENSFGRKDETYSFMVATVVCASRMAGARRVAAEAAASDRRRPAWGVM